jgi:MoaA/NifB/PqqE/SkfB family radical SAM enzyme
MEVTAMKTQSPTAAPSARPRSLPLLDDAASLLNYGWRGARLLEGFLRKRPIHCIVQVSNRCNLTCGFCSFWERPAARHDEMTVADFETISAKLAEAGSMIVSIEGGEPLLRADIADIVRAFARYHHPILFTNGWRVTPAVANNLWRAGLSEVGVSLDYADPARHDAHRGEPGTFDAALRAVEILRDSAPGGARQMVMISVIMHDNLGELEGLLEISRRLGVQHQMTLLSTGGDGRHDRAQQLPPPGTGARLLALKKQFPHFITFSGYLEAIDRFLDGDVRTPCWAGERFLNVDHMGDVSPCIEKLHLCAGNLRRDPWDQIAARLRSYEETKACTNCMTACRGFVEEMSGVPKARSWGEFFGNFANLGLARR